MIPLLILFVIVSGIVLGYVKILTDFEPTSSDRICWGCQRCWCDFEPGSAECKAYLKEQKGGKHDAG